MGAKEVRLQIVLCGDQGSRECVHQISYELDSTHGYHVIA
jgi:hypothetical protein